MSDADDAAEGADVLLGRQVRSGLAWSLLNNGVARAGTTVTGIVLARILAPEDFGVYAVALVVYMAVLSVNELGVSLAVVRWTGDVAAIAPTVATIALASSVLMYAVCFVAAPGLASGLGAPSATNIIRVLCLGVLVDGIIATPIALMQREFQQRRRMIIDQANFGVGAAVSILLALHGAGAWSLAWGRLAGNIVSILAILALSPARIQLGFDRDLVRPLIRFGAPLAGASLVAFAVLNVDYIIIGATLGPVELGLYVLAFNLSSWPVNLLSNTVRNVSLAGFSRQRHDTQALNSSFVSAFGWLTAVTVPVCALIAGLAAPVINLVYGPKWSQAAQVLPFLVVLGGCRVLFELSYDYLVAVGRSAVCLMVQALWLAFLIPVLLAGAKLGGIRGVGGGHMVVVLLVVGPTYLWAIGRTGVRRGQIAREVRWPLLGGVAAAAAAAMVAHLFTRNLWAVLAGGTVGALVYAPFLLPAVMRQIRRSPQDPLVGREAA